MVIVRPAAPACSKVGAFFAATVIALIVSLGFGTASALAAGSISGTVRDPSGALMENACITIGNADFSPPDVLAATGPTGTYSSGPLANGNYIVRFTDCSLSLDYIEEWYDNSYDFFGRDEVVVDGDDDTPNINAQFDELGTISGTVTDTAPMPNNLQNICVTATSTDFSFSSPPATTLADGTYSIGGLPPNTYKVLFVSCTPSFYISEYWLNKSTSADATPITLSSGEDEMGIDGTLALGGTISGKVTDNASPTPNGLKNICIEADQVGGSGQAFAQTLGAPNTGEYTISGLSPGNYTVEFVPCSGQNLVSEYWDDELDEDDADPVTVVAGADTPGKDAVLVAGASITGMVTDGTNPLQNICVSADGPGDGGFDETAANGTYELKGLAAGSYKVSFSDCHNTGDYLSQYYEDASFLTATPVVLTTGQVRTGVNAVLQAAGKITGHVTDAGGNPLDDICVSATGIDGTAGFGSTQTNALGDYQIADLSSGGYRVRFSNCGMGNFASEYYDNKPNFGDATPVQVSAPATTANINAALATGGTISGRVTADAGGAGVAGVCVSAFDNNVNTFVDVNTDANGDYLIKNLPAATYTVEFRACGAGNFASEIYNNKQLYDQAELVAVAAGQTRDHIDAGLAAGATISGTVTDGTNPLQNICVQIEGLDTDAIEFRDTNGTGAYSADGLPAGSYSVFFSDCNSNVPAFASEYFSDKVSQGTATPVGVIAGGTGTANAALVPAGVFPNMTISDQTITEGNSGQVNAVLTVSLSQASIHTVSVRYETTDSDATAGVDYASAEGELIFAPGETSKTISVSVNGDTTVEPDETFRVDLFTASNAFLTDDVGVVKIANDDSAPVGGGGETTPADTTPADTTPADTTPAKQCVVPKLKGKTVSAAVRALKAANCKLGKLTKRESKKEKGTVLGSSPKAGTSLAAGSKVDLVVAKKKKKDKKDK